MTSRQRDPRSDPASAPPGSPVAIDPRLARALFLDSPFSVVIYDAGGHPLVANDAFERLWGASLSAVPEGYSILTDPELERRGVLPLIRAAFAGERVETPALRYDLARVSATGSGRAVWTEGRFTPVHDDEGRLTHVVLTHIDLTERIEAEQALRQREERLRLAQRAAEIGTFDWDVPTGRVTWATEEERIFGVEPGSFGGSIDEWSRFVVPGDLEAMQSTMGAAMASGERELDFAYRIRRPDGQVRWIEGSAEFFYDASGTPLRMVGVNVDATERRNAEDQRLRHELLLRQTERIARLGSWEWVVGEDRIHWSEEMYALYGLEPGWPVDFEIFLAAVHPEDREAVVAAVKEAQETGASFAFDHRIVRPDGEIRYLHGRGQVIVDAQGAPVRMLGSGQDITERRMAEDALRAAKEEAEAASRAKSDFLAVMSHELRTPLNAIAGYAELIELGIRGPVTPEQQSDLQRIRESQRHLLGLINQVLNYARLEAGAVAYLVGEVRLPDVVAAAEAMIRPQAGAQGLSVRTPACPDVVVHADRDKVQQILLNLLSNAVKFTRPGGELALEVETSETEVAIHVRDTGIGIPEDKLPSIFEPFVQIGRGLNNPVEGVGLGLPISRDLARGMGGDLVAVSVVGSGTTFSLRLPRRG